MASSNCARRCGRWRRCPRLTATCCASDSMNPCTAMLQCLSGPRSTRRLNWPSSSAAKRRPSLSTASSDERSRRAQTENGHRPTLRQSRNLLNHPGKPRAPKNPLWALAKKISIPQHQPDDQKGALEKTMPASAEERLKKIIAEQLSVSEDELTPEANFIDDLNADSRDLVELIMSLEEEFNVKIRDAEAAKIRTVQDAMDYLHEHGGA